MTLEKKHFELLNFLDWLAKKSYEVKSNFQLTALLYMMHGTNAPKYEDIELNINGILASGDINNDLYELLSNKYFNMETPWTPLKKHNSLEKKSIAINSNFPIDKILSLSEKQLFAVAHTIYNRSQKIQTDYYIREISKNSSEIKFLFDIISACEQNSKQD